MKNKSLFREIASAYTFYTFYGGFIAGLISIVFVSYGITYGMWHDMVYSMFPGLILSVLVYPLAVKALRTSAMKSKAEFKRG